MSRKVQTRVCDPLISVIVRHTRLAPLPALPTLRLAAALPAVLSLRNDIDWHASCCCYRLTSSSDSTSHRHARLFAALAHSFGWLPHPTRTIMHKRTLRQFAAFTAVLRNIAIVNITDKSFLYQTINILN